jgi:hypothetical protein
VTHVIQLRRPGAIQRLRRDASGPSRRVVPRETPLSIARLSASAPSSHDPSLAAFTVNIAESNFRHTQGYNLLQTFEEVETGKGADALDRRP